MHTCRRKQCYYFVNLQIRDNFNDFSTFDNNVAVCADFDGANSLTNNDDLEEADIKNQPDLAAANREQMHVALDTLKN